MQSAKRQRLTLVVASVTVGCALLLSLTAHAATANSDPVGSAAAIAIGDNHVWVLNSEQHSGSVTEFNESNGSLDRVINAKADGFDSPYAMSISDGHVWVFNYRSAFNSSYGTVTELNESNGSLVRVIDALKDKLDNPNDIAVANGHLWLSNSGSPFPLPAGGVSKGSVTELQESDGSLIRVIDAKADKIKGPSGIVFNGGHLWISNSGSSAPDNGSLTELNASDGSLIRVIDAKVDGYKLALSITSSNGHLWINNIDTVTELNASNGALVHLIQTNSLEGDIAISGSDLWWVNQFQNSVSEMNFSSGRSLCAIYAKEGDFHSPFGIAIDGNRVWVLGGRGTGTGGSVSELNASNCSLVRVIK